LTTLLVK